MTTRKLAARNRLTLGGLDIAVIDPYVRDSQYIFDEIFKDRVYDHAQFRVPSAATIIDVGGNIGLYSIWAARRYEPAAIYAYEASPTTFDYLVDNTTRHVDPTVTACHRVNRAVSNVAGVELTLHQAPFTSGLSTLMPTASVPWLADLSAKGEIVSHKTTTTTLSAEIAAHAIARVDVLKIDVEGHFMEVLGGIAPGDWPKICNIVLEVDYLGELGLTEAGVRANLADKGFETSAVDATVYAWRS